MKLSFCLPSIMIAGALTVSGSLAEEAVPAPKETTTASPSTHASGQGSHPSGGTAISAHGSAEGSAGSKGTADNAGAKGKAGGNSTGSVRVKAGAKSIGSAKESGPGANAIDTRITVQPGRTIKNPPLGSEKKAISPAAPPSVNSARQTIPIGHQTRGAED